MNSNMIDSRRRDDRRSVEWNDLVPLHKRNPKHRDVDRENVSRAEDEVRKNVIEPDPEPQPLVGGPLVTMTEVQL